MPDLKYSIICSLVVIISSKIILYNYDSFLFDWDVEVDKLDYLNEVKVILERNGKYPTKVKIGRNYHEMEDITEKFV